ncbi:MAG: HAMP domain-containing sensor histidine kinase [Bacteroidota bacterium]
MALVRDALRLELSATPAPLPPSSTYAEAVAEVHRLQRAGTWEAAARLASEVHARLDIEETAIRQQGQRAASGFLGALSVLMGVCGLLLWHTRYVQRRLAKTEQALAQAATAQDQLHEVTQHTRIGLVIINVNGEVYQVNEAFLSMADTDERTLKRHGLASCFTNALDQRTIWAQLLHTEQPWLVTEVRMKRGEDDYFWALVRYERKLFPGQPGHLLLAMVEDISMQRAHEDGLREARDRAEEMAQAKNTFLANITHELCTPIAGILGVAGLMTDELEDAEHQEYLHLIRESGERLLATVNSILQLAQLESNSVHLSLDQIDLAEYLRHVLRYSTPPTQKNIDLVCSWPDEPIRVNVDRVFLQRIVQNLISNAFKYTKAGTVRVGVASEQGMAVLWVEDTGMGIDEEHQQTIFSAFTQASGGHSRSHEGIGLGLTITRLQVEHMDGTIRVRSKKGEGSRFEVRLPQIGVQRLAGTTPSINDRRREPLTEGGVGR